MSGNYTCLVENEFGTDEKSFILQIVHPPRLVNDTPTAMLSVPYFVPVNLSVSQAANPEASFDWYHLAENDLEFRLLNNSNRSTLSVLPNDDGLEELFKVLAKNKLGSQEKLFKVTGFLDAPPVVDVSIGPEVSIEKGKDLELPCQPIIDR